MTVNAPAHRLGHDRPVQRAFEPSKPLTQRQIEILGWVQEGKTAWEIGQILGLSGRSVDSHLRRIYDKLNVNTRMQAVLRAQRLGVLAPPP